MYSSSSQSKRFVSVTFLAVVATKLLFMRNVSSLNLTNTYLHHKCLDSQGFYKQGSAYEKQLTSTISFELSSNFRYGFTHDSTGKKPNKVTILYQCRGDSYWSKCRSCYKAATSELRRRCPKNKGGIIWFDQCFVEYSPIGVMDVKDEIDYQNIFTVRNPTKVSGDAKLFNKETMSFLEKLTLKANDINNEDDDKPSLYAAGAIKLGTKKLYAMVQCTRYVYAPRLCKLCLETLIKEYFPKCCDGKQGGRVLCTSCNFRYELYPFLRTNKTF